MSNIEKEQSSIKTSNDIVETSENSPEIDEIVPVKSSNNVNQNTRELLSDSKDDAAEKKTITLSCSDICRICHMGSFPPTTENRAVLEWHSQNSRRNASQVSILSAYTHLGPLISACKCRGTVGLIHAECLERWLTESGHTRCELCGHKYITKRVLRYNIIRSIFIWFHTVIITRQMLLDVLYLVVTTPLALFSGYICALAVKLIYETRFKDIPWAVVTMLPVCSLTVAAYWGYIISLSRLHRRRWYRYWRNNFVIQLIPNNDDNNNVNNGAENSVEELAFDDQQNDEDVINEFLVL